MAHEIENTNGIARFAYSDVGGVPWHQLGTSMRGLQTVDDMLKAAHADYEVLLTRVVAIDDEGNVIRNPNGDPVVIHDSRATIRSNSDGTYDDLATVGTRYEVRQNREVAERAMAVLGAAPDEAIVDTCGVLRDGRRFFITIDLGAVVVDPGGLDDKIGRYLVVSTGHDGVWPIRYANTDVRAVCNNTIVLGLRNAKRIFTARHTRNMDTAIEDAREVMDLSSVWSKELEKEVYTLLRIPMNTGSQSFDRIMKAVFPLDKDATARQRKNNDETIGIVKHIFNNKRNALGYGMNAWSAYNAVAEYLDHHRPADDYDRASASMEENSWVTRAKINAHKAILSQV